MMAAGNWECLYGCMLEEGASLIGGAAALRQMRYMHCASNSEGFSLVICASTSRGNGMELPSARQVSSPRNEGRAYFSSVINKQKDS